MATRHRVRVKARYLIRGDGSEAIENGVLIFSSPDKQENVVKASTKGVIEYAGPEKNAPPASADEETYSCEAVMPGMWDCHCHLIGLKTAAFDGAIFEPTAAMGARAAHDLKVCLEAGFTSVREVGGLALDVRKAVQDGTIPGPHVYASGAALSITSGHSDFHQMPLKTARCLCEKLMGDGNMLCDGPWECVKACRTQFRRGADVIKIMATGGVLSILDDPLHQEFNDEEILAIVKECESKDRIVAAHCHGAKGIEACLRLGVKTIEHGTYLTPELMDEMIKRDAILIPTMLISNRLIEVANSNSDALSRPVGLDAGMSPESLEKLKQVFEVQFNTISTAIAKGVTIACGTDVLSSGAESAVPWGTHAKELEHYVRAGMTPLEAIKSACANGPLTLGSKRAPKTGQLREGFDADILLLNQNPLDDISVLQDSKRTIKAVYKWGRKEVDNSVLCN